MRTKTGAMWIFFAFLVLLVAVGNYVGLFPIVYLSEYGIRVRNESMELSDKNLPITIDFVHGDSNRWKIIPYLLDYWYLAPPPSGFSIIVGADPQQVMISDARFILPSGEHISITSLQGTTLTKRYGAGKFVVSDAFPFQVPWSMLDKTELVLDISVRGGSGATTKNFVRRIKFDSNQDQGLSTPLFMSIGQ